MNTSTAITHTNGMEAPTLATGRFSSEERRIIKDVIAKGATDAELRVFLALCERTGLDPFTKQIYCIKRWDASEGKNVMTSQVSIDGLRILAERTGKYVGFLGPQWCGDDGVWRDVWLEDGPPKAARFGVKKEGLPDTFWAVARWGSYVQKARDGKPNTTWQNMPDVMLGNAAERLALRRAFPYDLAAGGLGESDVAPEQGGGGTGAVNEESELAEFEIEEQPKAAAKIALASAEDHRLIDDLLRRYKGLPADADIATAKRDMMVWVSGQKEHDPARLTQEQAATAIARLREKVSLEERRREQIEESAEEGEEAAREDVKAFISPAQANALQAAAKGTGFSDEEIAKTLQIRWGVPAFSMIPAGSYIAAQNLFRSKQWLEELRPPTEASAAL